MKAIDRSDDVRSAATSIQERLRTVDASSLDRLLAIREEQARIEAYRAKAETLKSGVAEAVHARVLEDYNKRATALERQSAPLQAQARAEYRKLRALVDEVARAREQARLEKDEIEFRHAVGELDDQQLAERLKVPQLALDRCQTDQTALDEQAKRFVAALGSEDVAEPSGPPDSAGDADVQERAAAKQRASKPEKPVASRPVAAAPSPASADDRFASDRTMLVDDLTRAVLAEEVEQVKAAAASVKRAAAVLPAALLLTEPTTEPPEYRLGEVNGIGRSDENKIRIVRPGVSRMNAVVTARPNGFTIKDLQSQNGTFVNGERIVERPLVDGDVIEIGTAQFVFRTPWPAAGGAASSPAARPQGKR